MSVAATVWCALMGVSLLLNANRHGKPRTGKHEFGYVLTAFAVQSGLLYWGGFFS